jgi:hypothetical protein
MAFRKVQDFDAPIPGMAMTHGLGDRPWQQPPQYNTIEEAIEFYIPRLADNKFAQRMLDIIERGVPITSLAETMTLGGVMQGLHTIDLAILLNPILVEFMEGMAKQAEIDYKLGDTDDDEKEPDGFVLREAMQSLQKTDIEDIDDEEKEEPEEKPSGGLMSRRGI